MIFVLKFFWTFSGKKKFFAGKNSSLYFDIFEKGRGNGGVGGKGMGGGGRGRGREGGLVFKFNPCTKQPVVKMLSYATL